MKYGIDEFLVAILGFKRSPVRALPSAADYRENETVIEGYINSGWPLSIRDSKNQNTPFYLGLFHAISLNLYQFVMAFKVVSHLLFYQ